jgi:hypothetical protein
MALDQSALLDLLGELKLTDVTDRIRVTAETLYQEPIGCGRRPRSSALPVRTLGRPYPQRCGSAPSARPGTST